MDDLYWIEEEVEDPLITMIRDELCVASQKDIFIGQFAVFLLCTGSLPILLLALCSIMNLIESECK